MRLRSPWQAVYGSTGEAIRCDLPDTATHDCEAVVYRRSFHRPTGMSDEQRVVLTVQQWEGRLESLKVNQRPFDLSLEGSFVRVDITECLETRNRIELVLRAEREVEPRLIGPVELGIL